MSGLTLKAEGLSRSFNRRPVFADLNFTLSAPGSLAITGKNGAGKSTLVRILAGVSGPTKGNVVYSRDGSAISADALRPLIGFVSPYLSMYEEFSARENLRILGRIRSGVLPADDLVERTLHTVNLWQRRNDLVSEFSSGMKQRLKLALAILHAPELLILDEPTSNLDADGEAVVRAVAQEQAGRGLLIVATNNEREAGWCAARLHLTGSGTDARQ